MSADDDEKFGNEDQLKHWLVRRQGVDQEKAEKASTQGALKRLLEHGYDTPSTLRGVPADHLSREPISLPPPVAQHFHNKLKDQQVAEPPQKTAKKESLYSVLDLNEVKKEFESIDSVLDYFKERCFQNLRRSENGVVKASEVAILKVDIPKDTDDKPDMLRVKLPREDQSHQRAAEVKDLLKTKAVFAAAVSGAGKTKLAFDLAQKNFSLYYDMNGGLGKVPQKDVGVFLWHCKLLAAQGDRSRDIVELEFDHLIAALFAARWIALETAKIRIPCLKEEEWLWIQTDFPELCSACYKMCVALTSESLQQIVEVLLNQPRPLFLVDEAQQLLIYDSWFRSNRHPGRNRPLGYAVVRWLCNYSLHCFCGGTNLRLADFGTLRSAAGGDTSWVMWYDFDFLDPQNVRKLIEHFLVGSEAERLDGVIGLLQGRPRFTAQAIRECLSDNTTMTESIVKYTDRMVTQHSGEASIRSFWERLESDGETVSTVKGQGPVTVWSIALEMLLRSLYTSSDAESILDRVTFPFDEQKELVSRGVSMIRTVSDKIHELMAEPIVLSAGITFCMDNPGVDIATPLLQRLSDSTITDPQHRGKLLELFVAVRLYEKPNRFMSIEGWPKSVQLPKHPPKGILVGVPLTDPRLKFHSFGTLQRPYWLALPENQAGPDIVGASMMVSCKTSTSEAEISSTESKKSIKTTTPSKLYTKADGSSYDPGAWKEKHRLTQQAVSGWTHPVVRVRVELPCASSGTRPPKEIQMDGMWHCPNHDVDNVVQSSDVMVYISSDNSKRLLDIDWDAVHEKTKYYDLSCDRELNGGFH